MNFNEKEQKLIRLGLNGGAFEGEAANAASALFRELRKRQITAEQFLNNSGNNQFNSAYESMYRQSEIARRNTEEKFRNVNNLNSELSSKVVRLINEITALQAVIEAAKKAGVNVNAGATTYQKSYKAESAKRAKAGSGLLSDREREFFAVIGRKAENRGDLSKSLYRIGHCKAEHGMIQIFLRKGLLEKREGLQKWHGLTAKGVEYYKTYCR